MATFEPYLSPFSNFTLSSYVYVGGEAPGNNWFSTNASGGHSVYGDGIPQSLILTANVTQTSDYKITGTWTLTGTLYTVDLYGAAVSSTPINDSGSLSSVLFTSTFTSAPGGIESGVGLDFVMIESDGATLYLDMLTEDFRGPGATSTITVWTSGPASFTTLTGGQRLIGTSGPDTLTGGGGKDYLSGGAGDDYLDGGAGADSMEGGSGADTYVVDNSGDVVVETDNALGGSQALRLAFDLGSTIDTVRASISYALTNYVENLQLLGTGNLAATGNSLDNVLAGNDGNNTLTGAAGNDTLNGGIGTDTMVGGAGNDLYLLNVVTDSVNETAVGSDGIDQVNLGFTAAGTYIMTAGVENALVTATGNLAVNVTGNTLANTLTGNAADNILNGGTGADLLIGGLGNDTYVLDNAGDQITELADQGTDRVNVGIATANQTYILGDHLENGTLTNAVAFNLTGNTLDNILTGNAAVNTLTGGEGNDTLIGGAGADSLVGGIGDDSYVVDNALDKITENLDQGTDSVQSSVTYTLTANLENLTLTGVAAINATGNELDNILAGNAAANVLNGGAGADTMIGGNGADTYVVDDEGDLVTETNALAVGGIDLVQSLISYTLGDNLEKLTLTGSAAIAGTGNTLANILTGNTGNNTLDGGAGIDSLIGGLGDDTYLVDLTATGTLQDTLTEAANAGTDSVILRGSPSLAAAATLTLAATLENLDASGTGSTKFNLTGNTLANTLTGNAADNILNGGTGADLLIGGLGNDTYVLDNAGDQITELADQGTDRVNVGIATANQTYILGDHLENGTLTNAVAFNLTGNTLDNILTGNAAVNTLTGGEGNDTLIGGAGADSLVGGIGDDSYVVDNALDKITENLDQGTDSVQSSVTYTLTANLENLTLTGVAAINATGNELDNILAGNAAANVLNGGAGADTMIGGNGADTYVVDDEGDLVTETNALAVGGIDLVQSLISYTLGDNLEKLTLTGSAAIAGTGNTLANILTGNTGNNTLDGGAGIDSLIGGLGDDTYLVDLTATGTLQDTLTEAANAGTDTLVLRGNATLVTAATLTLAATLENLDAGATGSTKLNLTGNALANTLTGNAADNILNGAAGNDVLIGGAGNDTLIGGAGNDTLTGGADADAFVFNVAASATNQDTVTDFVSGADVLRFDNAVFTAIGTDGALKEAAFVAGDFTGGQDATDRIVYNTTTGALYYDADGSGAAVAVQVAMLEGVASLAATDIFVM
jgi:Ca2+-binding RTX toxin-like protein